MQLHNKILSNFPALLGRQQENLAQHFRSELMPELQKVGRIMKLNPRIIPKSRARPTALGDDFEKVGRLESSSDNGYKDSALLALPAPLKKQGMGINTKK